MVYSEKWRAVPPGGLEASPGSSRKNLTGSWRSEYPVVDFDRCTHCMICWLECPDSCFAVKGQRLQGLDLDFCKGCGICKDVCPVHCIEMVPETGD